MCNICPVIHEAELESKNKADAAISSAFPTLFKGCLLAEASLFSGEVSKCCASGVSVKEGAMAFTLILLAANSDANDFTSPSTAPFADAMLA